MTLTDEPPGQKVSPIHTGFLKERDMWNLMKETKYQCLDSQVNLLEQTIALYPV